MEHFLYRNQKTNQISFPLGGIGTGCIGLAGNGRLIDWEIFNRPNKGGVNGFSHFAIRAENNGDVTDARILHGDLHSPYQGELVAPTFSTFGWGPRREYLTGLPHFESVDFRGRFPIAELTYRDDTFPGQVQLTAFNPFIPTNEDDSGIPAAFFEFSVTNTTAADNTYTVVGVLTNPLPATNLNAVEANPWGHTLHLATDGLQPDDPAYGNLTLATDAGLAADVDVSWQQNWFRGAWFDNLEVYWKDLNTPGPFRNRVYDTAEQKAGGARFTEQDTGLLAVHLPVAAGETRRVRFLISWSFPNCENYWKEELADAPNWKNYYATHWQDSAASAQYAIEHWPRLYAETKRFQDALFASTIPAAALDAVSANISILKSPTVLRLEDGTFYGWEGLHPDEGCCEGSCTHVWNYQQALPFLFPALERTMRTADYRYNLLENGAMPFRIQLPLGSDPSPFRPCCDGQFGGVMKTYRDWKISGDHEWLRSIWPGVKKSLEYAWSPDNIDRWDPDKSGVLTGRQHHTLDMELFGPNSWLTGFYLGALKAASEMAESIGDVATASQYHIIFERGKAWVDANLFNGEYYVQRVDLNDRALVESYGPQDDALKGGSALDAYWNAEHNEIKYQIGEGSSIDQVLAQWHASLYGLGDLHDPDQVKQACAAIYKYNFVPEMSPGLQPLPHLRPQRRRRPRHLRLARRRRKAAHPRPLLAGNHERLRIRRRQPHDHGRPRRRRHALRRGRPPPLRRRTPQPLERIRVRQQLRPQHGILRTPQRLLRLPVRHGQRRPRLPARPAPQRRIPRLLVPRLRLGPVPHDPAALFPRTPLRLPHSPQPPASLPRRRHRLRRHP